ncbi:MAG: CaiB/BaiF CoA transferase family protein [Acidimicrobiales bacterium]
MTVEAAGDHTEAHLRAAPMAPGRAGPLADVRVVDLTQAVAGPYCTMILADLGADVIKVERPGPDAMRRMGPFTEVDEEHSVGGYFASINRNKRSVELDLKDPADVETFLRLIATADIVVENFRAGIMDGLGLGYETLREHNPALIYGAIRGFGDPRTGETPYTYYLAYDVVAQATGGLISHTGTKAGERVSAGPSLGDFYPATILVGGILAALHHARATGEGQFVDVAMMDSIMAVCESLSWRYSYTGEVQGPRGAEHPSLCPFELYDTSDGQVAIAAPSENHWEILCDVIGRPELADDERFRGTRRRVKHRDEVREVVTEWTSQRTKSEVMQTLGGAVACGPVNDAEDLVADPHVEARQMYVAIDSPGSARPVITPNTPLRFTETPGGVYRAAPLHGEHTDEVLAELGNPSGSVELRPGAKRRGGDPSDSVESRPGAKRRSTEGEREDR